MIIDRPKVFNYGDFNIEAETYIDFYDRKFTHIIDTQMVLKYDKINYTYTYFVKNLKQLLNKYHEIAEVKGFKFDSPLPKVFNEHEINLIRGETCIIFIKSNNLAIESYLSVYKKEIITENFNSNEPEKKEIMYCAMEDNFQIYGRHKLTSGNYEVSIFLLTDWNNSKRFEEQFEKLGIMGVEVLNGTFLEPPHKNFPLLINCGDNYIKEFYEEWANCRGEFGDFNFLLIKNPKLFLESLKNLINHNN